MQQFLELLQWINTANILLLINHSNHINHHLGSLGHKANLSHGPRRSLWKISRINLIDLLNHMKISNEQIHLDHFLEVRAGSLENVRGILKHLVGLVADAAAHEVTL